MSIAQLKKITLAGRLADKTEVLETVQRMGCVHLVPLVPPPDEPEKAASREAQDAYKALRFLAVIDEPRRQVHREPGFDVEAFVAEVLELKERIRETGDRRDFLAARIEAIAPWGSLEFPPEQELAHNYLWFYQLPVRQRDALEAVTLPWQIVSEDARHLYVVLISPSEPPPDTLPVPRTHRGKLPIHELEAQLEEAEIELEALAAERLAMTRYLTLLRQDLSKAATLAELAYAREQTRDDDALFALQGWVPVDRADAVAGYAQEAGLAMLIQEPAWDETPPTLLVQPDRRTAGVDLAMFYQVPSYRDWDPTILLVGSFAIFFAMIVADAGYGAVLLAGMILSWRQLSGSPRARGWRRLGVALSLITIVYGALVGSYFGVTPPAGSLLSALHILDINNFDAMMQLSVTVGVIHLSMANLMTAWVNRGRRSAIASLGWVAAMVGALALWLSGMAGFWATAGYAAITAGALAILLFTSNRPIEQPSDWARRLVDGVMRLGGAMNAFGDALSYMRLFALGLASASLAITFNDLARSVVESVPGMGVLLGLLILLAGHALNFALALMSGVVHGLRLNYIEFYRWGLSEEGTAFRPFAVKEVVE